MNTKTCKKCGWVYPYITPYKSCRFCGMSFTDGICAECGEASNDLIPGTSLCRECYNRRNRVYQKRVVRTTDDNQKHYRRICEEADKRFATWTEQLKSITTHTLTEAEWMECCRYFNGCAFCDSDSIDARGYFVRFEDGGKYNACNIIPLCETCATAIKKQPNHFRRMNPYINRSLDVVRGCSIDKVDKAVEYLQSKIEEVKNESAK